MSAARDQNFLQHPLWGHASQRLVEHGADAPPVHRKAVVVVPHRYLGGHVLYGATVRRGPFQGVAHPCPSEVEVHEAQMAIEIQHEILRLEVAMQDPLGVAVRHHGHHLRRPDAHHADGKGHLARGKHEAQSPSRQELHYPIQIRVVFEVRVGVQDEGMLQFVQQLRLRVVPLQSPLSFLVELLRSELYCEGRAAGRIPQLRMAHLTKTAFSQNVAQRNLIHGAHLRQTQGLLESRPRRRPPLAQAS
eukprot:scaffold1201_cov247-Pinguiococcus_pyrenoidosus.AAC.3